MNFFAYQNRTLHAEKIPLREIAVQFGTPTYVYSYATLERHFKVFDEALSPVKHLISYAVKANENLAIIRALGQLGAGADVVSGGELFRALEAGISPSKIVFSGVGKTIEEIEYALRKKIHMLSVESAPELHQISEVAKRLNVEAPISLRLNPNVDPKTHPYISTGLRKNKFGIWKEEAMSLYKEASKNPHLKPIGVSFHIGSQITSLGPFIDAAKIAVDLVRELRKMQLPIQYLDVGGGLGVPYTNETPPSPAEYASALVPLVKDMDLTLMIEPGRAIVANAGVLVTRVIYVKKTQDKTFVIVDAGMNDLLRPTLYEATHAIEPVVETSGKKIVADIVGPVCESGDYLALDREIVEPSAGDLLAVRTTGAYGFAMASQYNARCRPAEVLVRGDEIHLIRKRETFEDLIRGEDIPEFLK